MKRRRTLERFLPEGLSTRRLLLIGVGLFLCSALVTLAVLLGGARGRNPAPGKEAVFAPAAAAATGQPEIGIDDLILPDEVQGLSSPPPQGGPPYLLRPPLSRWTEEQVRRYWVPLEDIALDHIRQENDRRVQGLFEGVP